MGAVVSGCVTAGRPAACSQCGNVALVQLLDEARDPIEPIITGAVECRQCGAAFLYARKAPRERTKRAPQASLFD